MINTYIDSIATRYKTGRATEHSYRGDLQTLLESLNSGVLVTNEPTRIKCGAPDYIITRNNVPVGYIEAKDIGVSLSKTDRSEQMKRYKASLDNLILTDYCEFWFYQNGEKIDTVTIAKVQDGELVSIPDNHERFTHLIQDFCLHIGQTIKSAQKLAKMMAGKAKMMQAVIEAALKSDKQNEQDSSLREQMEAFKNILIHDIQPHEFADIYAQTLAYGMFAARLHDPTLETFTRQEAAELIPKTNPFLRKLFNYIAGIDIDTRIVWIVDALADIFRATDVAAILRNFGESTQTRDPIIHFYETFLAAYNPKLRKSRGVWYTPEPVVNFIVRGVDELLKAEFGLLQGVAATSKTTIELDTQIEDRRSKTGYKREKREVHKVQILDPAAGTGTFLAEVVRHIHKKFAGQEGIWSQYVEQDLIPRLHGFEILMASYAMAHLKLELLLQETGFVPETQQRLRVFLTNSLEEAHPDTGTLWATWLSREATEANYIKRDTPVMVVLGNPPYAVSSSNKGKWIQNLIADYKQNLNEKKLNLDDDYIKFIRYAQYFIDKNRRGIVAIITNNSFLDGITHRQMRRSLLESFDKIYIYNLHGNSKRKETCPDGSKDENVFDIQQGVSISFLIKKESGSKKLAEVLYFDSFGLRKGKYAKLNTNSLSSVSWNKLPTPEPNYFFIPKDFQKEKQYEEFFSITELFPLVSSGIQTKRDKVAIQDSKDALQTVLKNFAEMEVEAIRQKYSLPPDGRDWRIDWASKHAQDFIRNDGNCSQILYRPFDGRWTVLQNRSKGLVAYPRFEVMRNMQENNVGLICTRQLSLPTFQHVWITKHAIDGNTISLQTREYNYLFPLYVYPEEPYQQTLDGDSGRKPNLHSNIIKIFAERTKLSFTSEQENDSETFAPINVLDYIYAVLHSPVYRESFKEMLKIDFPRVPYPQNQDKFWRLAELGRELRQIHLLESPNVQKYITTYPQNGNNTVTRRIVKKDYVLHKGQNIGQVWINDNQYFESVPQIAWEFHVGGFQPAQKWLKDRHGKQLSFEDIMHYQKIIVALTETERIMKEIATVNFME